MTAIHRSVSPAVGSAASLLVDSSLPDFAVRLLKWYDYHGRNLPWRQTKNPYPIWISEIILQQTRVDQGTAYYHRLLEAFPTVEALAAASEDQVLRLWQGLGYYSRARNLHRAARMIVEQGCFPTDYEGVRVLPGVGPYTAAAICSFAYDQPHVVVDGNVYRVLGRCFGVDEPMDTTPGKKLYARLALEVFAPQRSADFNQAIMDLGAMVCTPASPRCEECPLEALCAARFHGRPADYPVRSRRISPTPRYFTYLIPLTDSETLLHRRGKGDIWQGLYEFPLLEFDAPPTEVEIRRHPLMRRLFTAGSEPPILRLGQTLKHVLTHRIIYADAYIIALNALPQTEAADAFLPVGLSELDHYAMPKLLLRFRKLLPMGDTSVTDCD